MITKIALIFWLVVGIDNLIFHKTIRKKAYLLCLISLLLCIFALGKLAGV